MAVRGSAVHMNHNHTLYIYRVNHLFNIMIAGPGHILESTKWIDIKLGTYIDVNWRNCRRQEP